MPVTALIGTQWGDEGKGKIVDLLAPDYNYVVRSHGGNNAGHTMIVQGRRIVTHLIPSGFANRNATLVMGTGMVIDLPALVQEIRALERAGFEIRSRLKISDRAHVVLPRYIAEDKRRESDSATHIGTTQKGIGPAYAAKALRDGVRIGDFLMGRAAAKIVDAPEFHMCREAFEMIRSCVCDTMDILNDGVTHGASALLEGAHGTLLDLDHGTYPWVTSSTTTINGLLGGAGLNPFQLTHAIGVAKAYCTRVGDGPFPSEMSPQDSTIVGARGNEFGSTTGRPRRCGWFDLVAIHYAIALNGIRELFLTKLDVLSGFNFIKAIVGYRIDGWGVTTQFPSDLGRYPNPQPVYKEFDSWHEDITHCRTYADLPSAARTYVEWIVSQCGIPARISVGPRRDQMIMDR